MDTEKQSRVIKLSKIAWNIEQGIETQVTQLLPITKLVEGRIQCRDYFYFLVENSYKCFNDSQSLSKVNLIDNTKKKEIYEKSLNSLNGLRENDGVIKYGKELIDIYEFLQSLSHGWKRVSVHATRRKLEDPDLVLIEQSIRYSLNHWFDGKDAYFLTQYFCCDYRHYRLLLSRDSVSRINSVTGYFRQKHQF